MSFNEQHTLRNPSLEMAFGTNVPQSSEAGRRRQVVAANGEAASNAFSSIQAHYQAQNGQSSAAVAAALSRAQQIHNSRLEHVAATLGRAQQLQQTSNSAVRLNMATNRRIHSARGGATRVSNSSPTTFSYPTQSSQPAPSPSASSAMQQFNTLENLLFGTSFQIPEHQWPGTTEPPIPTAPALTSVSAEAEARDNREERTVGNVRRALGRRNALTPQQAQDFFVRRTGTVNPSIHPQFRSKVVVRVFCLHCTTEICKRGMKAILLGNTKVELYSTDTPPSGVQLVYSDYTTRNCQCRIRDGACLGCGNVVGYHVTQPCEGCLEACNNGTHGVINSHP